MARVDLINKVDLINRQKRSDTDPDGPLKFTLLIFAVLSVW